MVPMRQAIHVKLGRDTNGNQTYSAKAYAGSVRGQSDYNLNTDQKAAYAAEKLCKKLGWSGSLAGGTLPNGDFCFVFVD